GYIAGAQPVFLQELVRSSAFAERIIYSYKFLRSGIMAGEAPGNGFSESAVYLMFLGCDHTARFLYRTQDCFFIQGFDRMNIDHFGTDPFFFKALASFKSFPYEVTCGKNGDIRSFIEQK